MKRGTIATSQETEKYDDCYRNLSRKLYSGVVSFASRYCHLVVHVMECDTFKCPCMFFSSLSFVFVLSTCFMDPSLVVSFVSNSSHVRQRAK